LRYRVPFPKPIIEGRLFASSKRRLFEAPLRGGAASKRRLEEAKAGIY
jgi:hypothetical protein